MKTKIAALFISLTLAGAAHARDMTPEDGPSYLACQDLMSQLLDRYGRAPVCRPFLDANGNSISEMIGQIGLSDDGINNWMVITIHANAGSTHFQYNPDQINQVAYMIQTQGRGLTGKGQALYGVYAGERKLKQQLSDGVINQAIYTEVMKTMKQTETSFQNAPESSFVVHHKQ